MNRISFCFSDVIHLPLMSKLFSKHKHNSAIREHISTMWKAVIFFFLKESWELPYSKKIIHPYKGRNFFCYWVFKAYSIH